MAGIGNIYSIISSAFTQAFSNDFDSGAMDSAFGFLVTISLLANRLVNEAGIY